MNNWHPLLIELIRGGRKIEAIKLWAAVTHTSIERAIRYIDDVCSLRRPVPSGAEYPDVSADVLAFYRSEPWRERGRQMTIIDLAESIATPQGKPYHPYLATLRRMHRDGLLVMSGSWKYPILAIDGQDVPENCTDILEWMELDIKLNPNHTILLDAGWFQWRGRDGHDLNSTGNTTR